MAENSQISQGGPRRSRRGPGRPFQPGRSGNPGGRPKGAKTIAYNVRELVGEALTDPETRAVAVPEVQSNLRARRTVVNTLEFAAKLNREIGLGSDSQATSVTFIFTSNIEPNKLRRHAETAATHVGRGNDEPGTTGSKDGFHEQANRAAKRDGTTLREQRRSGRL